MEVLKQIGEWAWRIVKVLVKAFAISLWWILTQMWRLARTYLFPAVKKLYDGIPRKRTVNVVLICLLVVGLLTPILLLQLRETDVSLMKNPNSAAMAILNGTWEEQKEATRDILRVVGFETVEGTEFPKTSGRYMIPPEITLLADDAARKKTGGRLTLVQFSNLLKELDFPFEEGKDPVLLMQNGLRNWVNAAIKKPSAEGAEVPLFLQTMALNQLPAIDLTQEDWDPELYRLSYLEMELILGSFLQASESKDTQKVTFIDWLLGTQTASAASAPGSCSYAKQWFGQLGNEHGVGELTEFNIELVSMLAAELTGKAIDKLGNVVNKIVTSVSASMKLMKLGMLYWSIEVHVTPSNGELHKPAPNESGEEVVFTAKVGVNEEKYKEYLEGWANSEVAKEIKDCASFAGLPTPPDVGEIAADIDSWSVEWDLVRGGGGEHAEIGLEKNQFDFKGQLQMKVKRVDKISGEAKLVADILKESVNGHQGYEHFGFVVARALVETSKPPGLGTLIGSGKSGAGAAESGEFDLLGLSDTLLDITTGWFQEIAEPKAYGYTKVDYHTQHYPKYGYEGTLSVTHYYEDESFRSSRDEDGVDKKGYSDSYSHTSLTARGTWNVSFIMDYEDEKSFVMIGKNNPGSLTLSENSTYRHYIKSYCIVGDAPNETHTKEIRSGGKTVDSTWDGSLSRLAAKDGEYSFDMIGFYNFNEEIMVQRQYHSLKKINPKCVQLVQGDQVESKYDEFPMIEIDYATPNTQAIKMSYKEAFPKTLNGSVVIKDKNSETIWTLKLKRVDPVAGK